MTTSGTFDYNPSLGEIGLYAFNMIGVRSMQITQEHMSSLHMAANLLLASWANRGVNLWAVDLQEVELEADEPTYSVPTNTVMVLDAWVVIQNGDIETSRYITPISRTEYASVPNKLQTGITTTYWFDRLLEPTITLWLVPDGTSAQYLRYYRVRQLEDANFTGGQTVDIPYLWLDAFADGIAYRLSRAWKPEMAVGLKTVAEESYKIASEQNIEQVSQFISPQLSGYFNP